MNVAARRNVVVVLDNFSSCYDTGEIFLFTPGKKGCKNSVYTLIWNVILWCAFKYDYEQLSKICKELEYEHVFITGGMSLEDKQEAIRTFSGEENCPVVIANRRAGGIGINLVEASHSIVYSRNFSLGDELQSEARNHRGGSEMHDKIIKIDIVARGTIDELVLEALSNKQKLSDRIVDWAKE